MNPRTFAVLLLATPNCSLISLDPLQAVGGAAQSASTSVGTSNSSGTQNASTGSVTNTASTATATASSSSATGQPPDLVGHWKLDEGSGSTCNDSSGFANPAALIGAGATWELPGCPALDPNPAAIEFDAKTGVLLVALPNAALHNVRRKTVSAWIRPRGPGGVAGGPGRIVDKRQGISGWHAVLSNCSATGCSLVWSQDFSDARAAWDTEPESIVLNEWQHVAITHDGNSGGNTPAMYINGVAQTVVQSLVALGSALDDSNVPFSIGGISTAGRTFDGSIDDVRIYNRIFSSQEVQALYTDDL